MKRTEKLIGRIVRKAMALNAGVKPLDKLGADDDMATEQAYEAAYAIAELLIEVQDAVLADALDAAGAPKRGMRREFMTELVEDSYDRVGR